jgi:L-fucose mutarotase
MTMLNGLDPLLGPELLAALRSMGHGDELVLVDGNFPAASSNRPVIRLDGITATRALDAVLSVMPLDDFVPNAAWPMAVVGDDRPELPIFTEFCEIIARHAGRPIRLAVLERFAFYERARQAFVIVATGERRLYGNLLLKKGIIRPAEADR